MATHDYVLDNASGAAFRTDLNNALAAIVSNNSNGSSPATTYAYQWWADTSAGVLKIRNSANNAWIELLQLDGTLTLEDGSASTPALAFRDDLNTGIFSSAADTFDIATAGVARLQLDASETTFNEDGVDTDFRIEGDTDTRLFFLDAGTDRIGIGVDSAPLSKLHVQDVEGTTLTLGNTAAAASDGDYLSGIDFHIKDNNDTTGATCASIRTFADQNHTASAKGTALAFFTVDDDTTTLDERLRITQNGNVGIGTTSPLKLLDVKGAGGATVEQYLRNNTINLISIIDGTTQAQFGTETSHPLVFLTSNIERARLDTNGFLLVGKTSATSTNLGVEIRTSQLVIGKTASGTENGIFFTHGTSYVGGLNYSDSATSLVTSSDERLKKNIKDADDASSKIDAIKVRKFDWKKTGEHQEYGFVAQELESVFAHAVHTGEDDLKTKTVDYTCFVPMLVKEIQSLRKRVEALETA